MVIEGSSAAFKRYGYRFPVCRSEVEREPCALDKVPSNCPRSLISESVHVGVPVKHLATVPLGQQNTRLL